LHFDNFTTLYNGIGGIGGDQLKNGLAGFISFATIDIYDIENLIKVNTPNTETQKYINVCKHIQTIIKDSKKIDEKYKEYIKKYKIDKDKKFNLEGDSDGGIYIHTLDFLNVMTEITNDEQDELIIKIDGVNHLVDSIVQYKKTNIGIS
jgi:hypothetical protein